MNSRSTLLILFILIFCLSTLLNAQIKKQWGVTFGAGEWSNVEYTYDSPEAYASLERVKTMGATWVRLLVTWYQDSINTTTIYPIQGNSNLFTPTDQQLSSIINRAKTLGLSVMLSPILDPNWDIKTNIRAKGVSSRLIIGTYFNDSDWQLWFQSYRNFIIHYATLARNHNLEQFTIASELVTAFKRTDQWREIIKDIRQIFKGTLTVAGMSDQELPFWDSLDYIGIDAYFPLMTESDYPNIEELKAAWLPHVSNLKEWSQKYNKSVLFTEVGYCSAFRSHKHPWAMELIDGDDCSVWYLCVNLQEQANCYTALLETFTPKDWWSGVFWWLWRTDPSDGGTSDPGFSPVNKPSEKILADWYQKH